MSTKLIHAEKMTAFSQGYTMVRLLVQAIAEPHIFLRYSFYSIFTCR